MPPVNGLPIAARFMQAVRFCRKVLAVRHGFGISSFTMWHAHLDMWPPLPTQKWFWGSLVCLGFDPVTCALDGDVCGHDFRNARDFLMFLDPMHVQNGRDMRTLACGTHVSSYHGARGVCTHSLCSPRKCNSRPHEYAAKAAEWNGLAVSMSEHPI